MKCADEKFITLHPYDQMRYYGFKEFEQLPTKTEYTLISAGSSCDVFNHYDNIVLMWFEEPNCLWVPDQELTLKRYYPKIKKILTTCPYTTEYYNKLYNHDLRQTVFLPINIKNIPADFTKNYDVFYTGHVFHEFITSYVNVIKKFNHCIVSFNAGTHFNVDFHKKLQLNANSKISVVHNCLYNATNLPIWDMYPNHGALKFVKEYKIVPQMKTRTLEAAICKSLILAHYEPYKIIEQFLEVDKDFIYWYNLKDLEEKIKYILTHYNQYHGMVENAYNKVVTNYNTHEFFNKYLAHL